MLCFVHGSSHVEAEMMMMGAEGEEEEVLVIAKGRTKK